MSIAPVFIHSLFRSGSTYMFAAFRRSPAGYYCYQEPLNEHLRHAAEAPERLLEIDSDDGLALRHPHLTKPYFWEFYQVRASFAPLFKKELSYDWFFIQEDDAAFSAVASYFRCLIDVARGTPVFQCCRSFGRTAALRQYFGGAHVHLWRNPWDQWWSFKVGDYFDATTQLIFNAIDIPPVLGATKRLCNIQDIHDADIDKELSRARYLRLNATEGYLAFYALWLYSFLECERACEVSINIDALGSSPQYRTDTVRALSSHGIAGLDFADCKIVQAGFDTREREFFETIEGRVHQLFVTHGYDLQTIDFALNLRAKYAPRFRRPTGESSKDAARVREIALRQVDLISSTQRELTAQDAASVEAERRWTERAAAFADSLDRTTARLVESESALVKSLHVADVLQQDLATVRREAVQAEIDFESVRARLVSIEDELGGARAQLAIDELRLSAAASASNTLSEELLDSRRAEERLRVDLTHWYGVADKLNRDFLAVCNSRSWRMTAPLRYANAWVKKYSLALGAHALSVVHLPRTVLRRVSTAAWRYMQARPERKAQLMNFLASYPGIYRRLRSFASRYADKSQTSSSSWTTESTPAADQDDSGIRWSAYPASVRRVYFQLKRPATANSSLRADREA